MPKYSANDLSEMIPVLAAVIHQFSVLNWAAAGRHGVRGDPAIERWSEHHMDAQRIELDHLCRAYWDLDLDGDEADTRRNVLAMAYWHNGAGLPYSFSITAVTKAGGDK